LFTGLAATSAVPTLATDGVPCYRNENSPQTTDYGVCYTGRASREASIMIRGTGTGTVTGTFRLWGFCGALGKWVPVGTGADTTKGTLNAGAAIGEVNADEVLHSEPFYVAGHFDRLYLQCTAIGGTTPSFEAWIVVNRLPAV
jgi:hypothetical protein